jgi:hypothetical protein
MAVSTRDLDLRTDEEKKGVTTELQRLQKRDREVEAMTRCLLLEQAIRFILNARKPVPQGTNRQAPEPKPDTMVHSTLTHAQWEQIEELIDS